MGWQHVSEGLRTFLQLFRGRKAFPLFTPARTSRRRIRAQVTVGGRIPHTYAIATCEVSVAQFKRFLTEARLSTKLLDKFLQGRNFLDEAGSDDRWPVGAVSFYAAAHYCLWLSKREGIPRDEWCYESLDGSDLGPIRAYPDYLDRAGYRIPTYEEWMFALMADAKSLHYFGHTDEKISLFEWLAEDSGGHPQPVGTRRPNGLGLHDMLGNLYEWCTAPQSANPAAKPLLVGSSFSGSASRVRDWGIVEVDPGYPQPWAGFRVARTAHLLASGSELQNAAH